MKDLEPLSKLISLKGKKALITGSALGIGKAMAYRFAEAGADLELVDINERGLRTVAEELSKFKLEVGIHKVNLSSKEEIAALWEELKGKAPDILVNNAGIYPFKGFLEVDDAFFSKVMDINLKSALWMCQHMIRRRLKKGGVIINIGSIEALIPFVEGMAPYSISKGGSHRSDQVSGQGIWESWFQSKCHHTRGNNNSGNKGRGQGSHPAPAEPPENWSVV